MDVFDRLEQELHRRDLAVDVLRREPLSRHTTFRIGGPAELLATPHSQQALQRLLELAHSLEVRTEVLGNGSNLLVSDGPVRALVLKTPDGLTGCTRTGEAEISCGSGVTMAQAALFAMEQGLAGLEFAHGIPGTVGGGVVMNAGAYQGELKDVVIAADHLTLAGEAGSLDLAGLAFGYRRSAYSDGGRIITRVTFRLHPGDPGAIRARIDELWNRRKTSQPLEYPSAGSTFKRPAGHYAAALIEQCGLKGLTVGGAQVSEKHSGFVINRGGATCADVLALTDRVREEVFRQTGVTLELEVRRLS